MPVQLPINNSEIPPATPPKNGFGDILALGFGATVAMWAIGYVGHMPLTQLPTALFVSAMLLCLVVAGFITARTTSRGLLGALLVGLVSSLLNLLILGSLLYQPADAARVPNPLLWLPGAILLSMTLAGLGALLGRRSPSTPPSAPNWPACFAWVTCAAAFLLLIIGGLVTGFRAGMTVPDWPNSYGANMFLFPLQRMTGGVFYEHAHRLLGSLVGIATLALALFLTLTRQHRPAVRLVWLVGACIALQGLMGGLRVTRNSAALAVIHGFFAHAVLAGLVAVAILLTRRWRAAVPEPRPSASTDHVMSAAFVALILLQTFLGALLRQLQFDMLLVLHITFATFVAALALAVGMRAWALNPAFPILRRTGIAILLILFLQLALGVVAVVFRTPAVDRSPLPQPSAGGLSAPSQTPDGLLSAVPDPAAARPPQSLPNTPASALLTTAHQANAAILLVAAVLLAFWSRRLLLQDDHALEPTPADPSPVPASAAP